jgi:hypothetical protein
MMAHMKKRTKNVRGISSFLNNGLLLKKPKKSRSFELLITCCKQQQKRLGGLTPPDILQAWSYFNNGKYLPPKKQKMSREL